MAEVNKSSYKPSQFNEYLGEMSPGIWIIYNNLSGAMLELNEKIYDAILSKRWHLISKMENFGLLEQKGIICSPDIDEIEIIRSLRGQSKGFTKSLALQILPTLACNFKCFYCYESNKKNQSVMQDSVIDKIIQYVSENTTDRVKYLNVMWFGGEPLLALDKIERLSQVFLDLSSNRNIQYFSGIVTNGFLLDEKNIDILLKSGITFCQVTIDGPEKIHDKRRVLKSGKKTWKKIINNLVTAVEKGLSITVRINIDKVTIEYVEELIDNLKEIELLNKIHISLGIVSNYGNVCKSVEDSILTIGQATNIIQKKNLLKLLPKKNELKRIRPDSVNCIANSQQAFIIGPEGQLYKCARTIGDANEECGSIFNFSPNHPNFLKWTKSNNVDMNECKSCSMIPICNGRNCAYHSVILAEDIYNCDKNYEHKKHIEQLKTFYLSKKHSNV